MKNPRIVLIGLLVLTGSSLAEAKKARGTCTYTLNNGTLRTKKTSQKKCQRKYTATNNRRVQGVTQWTSNETPRPTGRHHRH